MHGFSFENLLVNASFFFPFFSFANFFFPFEFEFEFGLKKIHLPNFVDECVIFFVCTIVGECMIFYFNLQNCWSMHDLFYFFHCGIVISHNPLTTKKNWLF